LFWGGLGLVIALVMIYFLVAYQAATDCAGRKEPDTMVQTPRLQRNMFNWLLFSGGFHFRQTCFGNFQGVLAQ